MRGLLVVGWLFAASTVVAQTGPVTEVVPPLPASADDIAVDGALNELEAKLSTGRQDSDAAAIIGKGLNAADGKVRAHALHVAAWLPINVAVGIVIPGAKDPDPRVRVAAIQGLTFMMKKVPPEDAAAISAVLMSLLDDGDDSVACAAWEWAAQNQQATSDIAAPRLAAASDVRHACIAPLVGIAPRTIVLPPSTPTVSEEPPPPPSTPLSAPTTSWLAIAAGASGGALMGAAVVPSLVRTGDVLVYTARRSRTFRQSASFAAQLAVGAGGAVVVGGALFGLDMLLGPAPLNAQVAMTLATASGALAGAGVGYAIGNDRALPLATIAGTAVGLGVGVAASRWLLPTPSDNAVAMGVGFIGGVGAALSVATVLPVTMPFVFGAARTDFILGTGVAAMGALPVLMLAASPFVDVSAPRSVAVAATSVAGAGLAGLVALAVTPNIEVRPRIGTGAALAGLVLGAVGGFFWPDEWLPGAPQAAPVVDAAVVGTEVVPTVGLRAAF
jgi:hypothetical protein